MLMMQQEQVSSINKYQVLHLVTSQRRLDLSCHSTSTSEKKISIPGFYAAMCYFRFQVKETKASME